jgi:putative ABC transport system substrate-binding protein
MTPDLAAKRVEILREIFPSLKYVTFLGSTRDPATTNFVRETRVAVERFGVRFEPVLVAAPEEIEGAFATMAGAKVDAVIVQPIFAFTAHASARVAEIAVRNRLPTVSVYAHFARAGGLISYGPSPDFGRRAAAHYVNRILKGAKPGELAVEQPTNFELVVNLKTARALGLEVPPSMLARADEVIE